MILFKKKILFVGALVIGGIFFSSCGGQETTSTTVEAYNPKITMDPKKGEIGLDGKITLTLSPKNKAASIYYEIVKGNAEPTITKENFASYTKYSKFVAAKEADFGTEGTIYAVAVKDGVAVSDITKATFKPRDLETYVLPSGATGDVPAWTKSNDGVQNLPDLKLHGESSNVTPELLAALETAKADDTFFKQPKNYILMMGDGMGVSQIVAATQLRGPLLMNQLPYKAVACSFTRDVSDFTGEVTDSGAGGTKLATGYRTTKLFAGIDAEGNELLNLSELARSKGKKVGIVTNAELADATPADFTVHNKNRSQGWTKICQQEVLFGADLFMGGTDSSLSGAISSLKKYLPVELKTITTLSDIIAKWDTLGDDNLMWNLFGGGDTTLGRWNFASTDVPSMQQQMALSLSRLQKTSGDNGFFLMFENTYTDIYAHWNEKFASQTKEWKNTKLDADVRNITGIINEVKDFDECLAVAIKFVLENPDTVLLVTADHETGNMQFRNGWENDYSLLRAVSGNHSNQNLPIFAIGYGMSRIDTKNGALFTVDDCTSTSGVVDNTICDQTFGDLMNGQDNSFGGDINTDTRGRTRDTFTVTTTAAANSVEFNLNVEKLPVSSDEYIQLKIKPYSGASSVTVKAGTKTVGTYTFASAAGAKVEEASPLSAAYKHAFKSSSGKLDGWYQLSVKPGVNTTSVTLSFDGAASAGSEILIDDFTVQYGSTKGYVTITGDNVTATKN